MDVFIETLDIFKKLIFFFYILNTCPNFPKSCLWPKALHKTIIKYKKSKANTETQN